MKSKKPLQAKDISALTGIGRETLRFYESSGLIPKPQRSASGYRQFSPETIDRIKFIKLAQTGGFSLKEIKSLLNLPKQKSLSKAELKEIASQKLKDLDKKAEAIAQMKQAIQEYMSPLKNPKRVEECILINNTFNLKEEAL